VLKAELELARKTTSQGLPVQQGIKHPFKKFKNK